MEHKRNLSAPSQRVRLTLMSALLAALSAALLLGACAVGSARYSLPSVLDGVWEALTGAAPENDALHIVLFQIRLPRALLAYVVGAALSVSGACVQGVFKNPMADPHILGVSAGAALGAALAMVLRLDQSVLGGGALAVCAFIGGALAVLLVLFLARTRGRISTLALLLCGVAVGSFLTAMLSGLMVLNRDKMERVYLWTMGSFTAATWEKVAVTAPVTLLGALLLLVFARDLNALLLGEEEARSLGVRVERVRMGVLGLCTLLTGAAVSVSGVIGFVGLMVPHAVRLLVGPDHRVVLPVSVLAGGCYLLLIDTLARTLVMPLEIPVGVLTALVGGPFFLILLKKARMEKG